VFTRRFFFSGLILACCAIPASATLTTYTALPSFTAANTDQTFQNITFPSSGNQGTTYTDLLTLVAFSSGSGLTAIPSPTGWPSGTAIEVTPNSAMTKILTIALPASVTSLGMYLGPQNFNNFEIIITDAAGASDNFDYGAFHQSYSDSSPVFFGLRTNSPITSFTIKTYGPPDDLALDSVMIGGGSTSETPEVATFLMIGSGLLMLRYGRRWMPRAV
jgi:hypothetical protein